MMYDDCVIDNKTFVPRTEKIVDADIDGDEDSDTVVEHINENPHLASSIIKSEKLTVDPENVNDNEKNNKEDVEANDNTTENVTDDDDRAKGRLQSKANNFNESISAEFQNQQTDDTVEQALELLKAEHEVETEDDDGDSKLSVKSEIKQQKDEKNNLRTKHSTSLREDISSTLPSSSSEHEEDDEDNEDFSADHEKIQKFNSEWESLAEDIAAIEDENNDLNNDIDIYYSIPIDLSNDIAINDILAAEGAPQNPDAEVFSVHEVHQPLAPASVVLVGEYHTTDGRSHSVGLSHLNIK